MLSVLLLLVLVGYAHTAITQRKNTRSVGALNFVSIKEPPALCDYHNETFGEGLGLFGFFFLNNRIPHLASELEEHAQFHSCIYMSVYPAVYPVSSYSLDRT